MVGVQVCTAEWKDCNDVDMSEDDEGARKSLWEAKGREVNDQKRTCELTERGRNNSDSETRGNEDS